MIDFSEVLGRRRKERNQCLENFKGPQQKAHDLYFSGSQIAIYKGPMYNSITE